MATKLTKKQQTQLTEKLTGIIQKNNALQLRLSADRSVNEMNVNQISGELNRIHDMAIGKELPTVISIPVNQTGTGDPSPDNIRSIVGYEIDGIGTVYGGELNIETGVLTVTYQSMVIASMLWSYSASAPFRCFTTSSATAKNPGVYNVICDRYATAAIYGTDYDLGICGNRNNTTIYIRDNSYQGVVADFLAAAGSGVIVYELATPETYTLTLQQMIQLLDQL